MTTPYTPEPTLRTFASRAQTQENAKAQVTVAVLDAAESAKFFGVPLARRGIQPVYLRIVNRSDALLRLQLVRDRPELLHAARSRRRQPFFDRQAALGVRAHRLDLSAAACSLIPFKLITAYRANRRMDEFFRSQAFHLRPIPPGGTSEGFRVHVARRGHQGRPRLAPLDRAI